MSILFQLSALFLGIFLLFIGNGLYLASAGVQLTALGVSDWIIGAVNAAYFIGAVISGMAAHRIISKVGHIRSFSVFVAVIALCLLAHTLTTDMAAWAVFRLLQGFCYYGLLMVAESWINEKSPDDKRARMMAAYEITYYCAFAIGALLIAFNWGLVQTFIVASMLMIAATLPLGLTRIAQPVLSAPERISVPRLANIVPLALAGSICGGIVINGFFTMASVFALKQGLNVQQTSFFLTAALLGGFLVQLPIGKFSDSYGRRNAIVLMSGIAAAAALLLGIVQWFDSLRGIAWLQYTAVFFFGAGGFCLYSLSVARANDVLNQESGKGNLMEISRGLLFAYGIGSLLGPLLAGAAMHYLGGIGFALVFAAATAALFAFALSQPGVARADRVQYVPTPGTASVYMAEIDPRTDENAVPHPVDPLPEENTDTSRETLPEENTENLSASLPEENTDISRETLPEENTDISRETLPEENTDTSRETLPEENTENLSASLPEENTDISRETLPEENTENLSASLPEENTDTSRETLPEENTDISRETLPEKEKEDSDISPANRQKKDGKNADSDPL